MSKPTSKMKPAAARPPKPESRWRRLTGAFKTAPNDNDAAGFRGFEQEAGELMSRAKTQRAQTIVRAAVVVVALLLVWAALAKVDEITKGEARVISSRQLQLVQSLDGGVVSEILVKEGQVVEKDQLLLKIDETRAPPACARAPPRALRCGPGRRGCGRWPKARRSTPHRPATTPTSAASSRKSGAFMRPACPS